MQAGPLLNSAPAGTRCILGAHCLASVASLLLPSLGNIFNLSVAGLLSGKIASLPAFWLVAKLGPNPGFGLLFMVISAFVSLSYLPPFEQEYGTLKFLTWYVLSATFIGSLYIIVAVLMAQFDPLWYMMPCNGLWPMLVLAMTLRSLAQPPDAATSLFGFIQLPMRWYPLALIAFFSLMSMRFEVALLAAWIFAVAAHQGNNGNPLHPMVARLKFPLHKMLPSTATISSIEETNAGGGGQTLGGGAPKMSCRAVFTSAARMVARYCPASLKKQYISASAASGQSSWGGGSAVGGSSAARARNAPAASSQGSGGSGFTAFSGAGQRLGEV